MSCKTVRGSTLPADDPTSKSWTVCATGIWKDEYRVIITWRTSMSFCPAVQPLLFLPRRRFINSQSDTFSDRSNFRNLLDPTDSNALAGFI